MMTMDDDDDNPGVLVVTARTAGAGTLSPAHFYIMALLVWILADVQYLHPGGTDSAHTTLTWAGSLLAAFGLIRHLLWSKGE
jgi:hypothetical protein